MISPLFSNSNGVCIAALKSSKEISRTKGLVSISLIADMDFGALLQNGLPIILVKIASLPRVYEKLLECYIENR